ncbi:MAG: UDP-galactopyranose mutase [Elusimicrobiaceae bacterium]|nr:UDP-galactopyranose mutase [Elusimicrobiaceae bacterium]
MRSVKNLIVGCGLSGAVVAQRLALQKNEEVLVIDRRSHIGGNIFDAKDPATGITVHRYGPHAFHTNSKEVWDYLSQFTQWHRFMHRVKAVIDGREVIIPFNLDSLYQVFPQTLAEKLEVKLLEKFGFNQKVPILELRNAHDKDLDFLAQYVYEKVFLGYTTKQWGVKPEELDPSVSARVPVYIGRDDRYFQDTYQAIPQDGYTTLVKNMLSHPKIHVELNTDFKTVKDKINYERLFFTGAIDEFFDYELGRLPYRSLDLVFRTHNMPYLQSGPQINYPENYDYTRSTEYKYFLDEKSDKTVVSYEYSCPFEEGKNERYYPIPDGKNAALYTKYAAKARALKNVWFLGRLGDYKYYNMDQTVLRALKLVEQIEGV